VDSPDYLFGSAKALARAIATREISATEVVTAHLARIEAVNPKLNAVVTHVAERALHEAHCADQRIAKGKRLGRLHGVPMTVKDSFDTQDVRSTASTEGQRHRIPGADATVISRLRRAGAIVLGKTNTPELTMGIDTESPLFGRTNNPYNPLYSPSGSSGGAGSILAAGGSALDVGSDTGGSIREPAHVCGVVGLKPTAGRLPKTGHAVPFGIGLTDCITQVGPMARYVEDVELALEIMKGPDGHDFTVMPVPLRRATTVNTRNLRIAYFTHNGLWDVHGAVAAATQKAVAGLRSEVHQADEIAPPPIAAMGDLYTAFRTGDGGWGLRQLLKTVGTTQAGDALRNRIESSNRVNTQELASLVHRTDQFKTDMYRFMQNYDALVCPPCPYPPWLHEAGLNSRYEEWSYCTPFNLAGWPAIVLRASTSAEGLPIGVQIVAAPWREDILLALAAIVERDCGGYERTDY
jgi:amidase